MPFFTEGAGVKSFTDLNDTPGSIVAGQAVRGNASGTALEFYVPSGGSGGAAIDDSTISTTTTFSSSRIVTELSTKASTASLNTKLNLTGGALTGDVTTNVPNGSFTSTSLVSKNYVDNAVGGASGATTYTALTDTPASHSSNSLLYSTGSAIAHTTTQIAIDGNGVSVNQLNARVNGTSNIGDSSHKFNDVFCNNIHQGNVKLVIPSARGSTGQYLKVQNATGETHTLEFANVINDAAASSTSTFSSTRIEQELDNKADKSAIQTTAEGVSTSETDVYSCNSVFSKTEIGTSVTSQDITVNHPTALGKLKFGSNLTSGLYGSLQSFVNGTRYSSMDHYATGGNCNIDWYMMQSNSLTKTIGVRPNGSDNVFEVLTGGIKAPLLYQRDNTSIIKIGRMDSASLGIPGIAIIPLINTINSEIQMRGLRNTGILADSYVQHQNGSTLTIQSRLATNRHSTTHANIEVSTYQNGAETKVLDIGASSASAKTLTITGTTHSTGHITTGATTFTANDQLVTKQYADTQDALKLSLTGGALSGHVTTSETTFSANNQLVSKQYVDAQIVAGGGASQFTQLTDTPSSYTANRFLKSTGSALDWFELNSKTLTWDFYNALADLPSASANHGMLAHVHAEAAVYYAHNGSWVKIANDSRVDSSVANITLSGADLSVTRQDGSAFLVTGVNPPALSWAVTSGVVSSDGSSLQLTQTNNASAPNITGLTPNTIADTCYTTSSVLSGGGLQFTKKDGSNVVHPAVLLPPISSGTNQYVLANNGTNAEWMSTITASASTLNFGTSTIKNFMSWALGYFGSYFLRASPSNGDDLGALVFGDTSLNYYSSVVGKVDNNVSRDGHLSLRAAKSGTLTEQLVIGKSDHSTTDVGQFAGTLKVGGVKFSGNTTQTKPVEDPATAGHVLTAGAGGTWSWAAPSGGVSPTYIDIHCQVGVTTPSGATNITNNNPTNESPTDRKGVSWGKRIKTFFIHEGYDFVSKYPGAGYPGGAPYNLGFLAMFNGRYAGTLLELGVPVLADSWMPYYVNEYGWFDYQSHSGHRYNFNKIAMYFYGAQPTDRSGNDYFTIYGSNDGVNFDTIANLRMQDFLTTTPTGYTSAGAGVGSGYSTVWFSFTNNNFYRIYRWQWKDFTNVVENTGTANYFRYGKFLAENKYCAEIEFH